MFQLEIERGKKKFRHGLSDVGKKKQNKLENHEANV